MGNMASSASAQIEATAGSKLKTRDGNPDYGLVSAILIAAVSGFIIFMVLIGREFHGVHFEEDKVRSLIRASLPPHRRGAYI